MPTDPSDFDFVVTDAPAAVDEDLPETANAPWWLRARVPLAVAVAVALVAALLFRVSSSGSDEHSPAAGPGTGTTAAAGPRHTGPTVAGPTWTIRIPSGVRGHVVKIGPIDVGRICHVQTQCIMSDAAPQPMVAALHDLLPHAHVTFARTFVERTGIAGRHHRFRSATVVARRGAATVRITVSRTATRSGGAPLAGERETAFGSTVYAHAYFGGYFISIDVTAPTGHAPVHIGQVLRLVGDSRLRPAS